jgi:hypothetical protein
MHTGFSAECQAAECPLPPHVLAGSTEEGKMAAYSEMGKSGAKKGGYSTGYAHDPQEQAKYTDRTGNETPMDD